MVVADWNMSPQALRKTSFLGDVGGEIVLPDVRVTCDKGAGSLIDYVVASKAVAGLITVRGVLAVPWKVHCGLRVSVEGSSTAWWHRALVLLRPIPAVDRPLQAPDPASKSFIRKQAGGPREEASGVGP